MKVNHIDKMADALVDVLKYSNADVEWVEPDDIQPNDGVEAEWFYPSVESPVYSEITAILQYTQQEALFDDISELMLGVALVEMKHYACVRDIIVRLGGTLPRPYTGQNIHLGDTPAEALEIAMKGEMATIDFYSSLGKKMTTDTPSTRIVHEILRKLIADETLHLSLMQEEYLKLMGHEYWAKMKDFAAKVRSYFA